MVVSSESGEVAGGEIAEGAMIVGCKRLVGVGLVKCHYKKNCTLVGMFILID